MGTGNEPADYTLQYMCARPKPESLFPSTCHVICFVFKDLR